jgi:hypothetical protein
MTQWCHGAPAFAFVFMKAAEVLQDPQWLMHAHRSVRWFCFLEALLTGSPPQGCRPRVEVRPAEERAGPVRQYFCLESLTAYRCHGISGNGYVFLKMYQLTNVNFDTSFVSHSFVRTSATMREQSILPELPVDRSGSAL